MSWTRVAVCVVVALLVGGGIALASGTYSSPAPDRSYNPVVLSTSVGELHVGSRPHVSVSVKAGAGMLDVSSAAAGIPAHQSELRVQVKLADECGGQYAYTNGVTLLDQPLVPQPTAGRTYDGVVAGTSPQAPSGAGPKVVCTYLVNEETPYQRMLAFTDKANGSDATTGEDTVDVLAPGAFAPPTGINAKNPPVCSSKIPMRTWVDGKHLSRTKLALAGGAIAHCPERVRTVGVAVARLIGHRCAFLWPHGRWSPLRSCAKRSFRAVHGARRWTFTLSSKRGLASGRYLVWARVRDTKGHVTRNWTHKHVTFSLRRGAEHAVLVP
ncbi:MAG: hypothetical protein J2O48_09995 [Solirubrobacterales bacterium]|nr:hypothetical protein [Solirubrobacterales bacterium]